MKSKKRSATSAKSTAHKGTSARTGKATKSKGTADTPAKFSALDAAAKVLKETKKEMTCREMIDAMASKGYWKSPGGKTPWSTLYASILREMNIKGEMTRFRKSAPGRFRYV
jgi:hypothetical protein